MGYGQLYGLRRWQESTRNRAAEVRHENMIADVKRIEVNIRGAVGRIRLANPPLNVLDIPLMRELSTRLAELEARADISVIVFEGDARAFSAGVDIKAHVPELVHEMLGAFHAVIRAIVASRKVTIAAVRGTCLGGARNWLRYAISFIRRAMRPGDFLRSSWDVIRQWQRLRFRLWWDRSGRAN